MDITKEEISKPDHATLSNEALSALGQALGDIRGTLLQLQTSGISPLAVLDATALDALKDVYYTTNIEDPLNAMPARSYVLEQGFVESALLPLVIAVNSDPASEANQKRWSVPMYHSLRLLSVLSLPISSENTVLTPGSRMDQELLKLRMDMAYHPQAVLAFVSLLQYYIERKAEKQAALASAEESKLEDARIDIILRFFRNLLGPLRKGVGTELISRDSGVHLALVGALAQADLYSTLSILFSSEDDAKSQYKEVLFLVADIFAYTYRYTSPRQMHRAYKQRLVAKQEMVEEAEARNVKEEQPTPAQPSVFDEAPSKPTPVESAKKASKNSSLNRISQVRAALLRERAAVGGSRAITTAARWTSRHSGGVLTTLGKRKRSSDQNEGPSASSNTGEQSSMATPRNASTKRVISTRRAIQSKLSLNPTKGFQDNLKINSDILCLLTAKGRMVRLKNRNPKSIRADLMRKDLQDEGLVSIAAMTNELIELSFPYFIKVLREQIEEIRSRALGDEAEGLMQAQKSFVTIVGSVVGFQREKYGKVFKEDFNNERSLSAQMHENCMDSILASDFKVAKQWRPVESGIELETFKLVFRTLVDGFQSVKNNLKEEKKVEVIEQATSAILEMMKLLQSMVTSGSEDVDEFVEDESDANGEKSKASLSARELALNTLEELFEDPDFLNAPAELARDFSTKLYSYKHLANVIEVTHAFTRILLNEKELAQLRVAKKKGRKNQKKGETKKEGDEEEDENATEKKITSSDDSDENRSSIDKTGESGVSPVENNTPSEKNDSDSKEPVQVDKTASGDAQATADVPDKSKTDGSDDIKAKDEPKAEDEENESSSDEDSEDEMTPQLREIESIGIIKRFATGKAVQSLLLPLRAGLCKASLLSGAMYNVPEGATPLLSPVVIAKASHVLAAIWKVAKVQERGSLCGAFFTFGTMHFLCTVLEAAKKSKVLKQSVLERSSIFAGEVTREFFKWLKQSPSLTLDMLFVMDKKNCQEYATAIYRKNILEQEKVEEESESEVEATPAGNRRGNIDFEVIERRVSARKTKMDHISKLVKQKEAERRRAERGLIEEDEDVDDIDNLDIGGGLESSSDSDGEDDAVPDSSKGATKETDGKPRDSESNEEDKPKSFCRLSRKKRKPAAFDPFDSDDEAVKPKARRRSRKKETQNGKTRKAMPEAEKRKIFESSDEYQEDYGVLESSDDSVKVGHGPKLNQSPKPSPNEARERREVPSRNASSAQKSLRLRKERLDRRLFTDSVDLSSDDEPLGALIHKKSKGEGEKGSAGTIETPPTASGLGKRSRGRFLIDDNSSSEDEASPAEAKQSADLKGNVANEKQSEGSRSPKGRVISSDSAKQTADIKRRRLIVSDDESE